MQTAGPMFSLCTTRPRGLPSADNEAGWQEALAKLAELAEAGDGKWMGSEVRRRPTNRLGWVGQS
jgi:hypothetical protein